MKKTKRIIGFVLAMVMCICNFGTLVYSAPGGEETWIYSQKSSGRNVPFAPADKYVSEQNSPDFMWPYVTDAEKYDLIVCSDPQLKDIKYYAYNLTNNFYTFPNTFYEGVYYYWAVRYFDGTEYSDWSNARRFRIKPGAYEFAYLGADALMSKIPIGHPRIYVTQNTLQEVRNWNNSNPQAAATYNKIIAEADRNIQNTNIEQPILERDPDNEGRNAQLSQIFRGQVSTIMNRGKNCAIAYVLTGDERYGNYAINVWMSISDWDVNGDTSYTSQDQVHREIALNGAISYDYLYDLMTAEQRQKLLNMVVTRTKVMEHLLSSLEKSPYDSHGWTAYGFIGIIALALYGDVPDAATWMKKVLDGYVSFLPPWSYQDGGWSQGTDYWQYSSNTNKDIIEILALADIIDLNQKAWCRNEYLWMLYAYPPNSYGSFGDQSNRTKSIPGYSSKVAARQLAFDRDNGVLKWLINQWGGLEKLVGTGMTNYYITAMDYDIEEKAPDAYPLAHEFSDIGWTVMSDNLIDPNRIQCTFKSSHYGSFNHSHADQNSFIIQAYGENLAIKSGYYDSYHSNHDSGFTRKTGAHNSVTMANSRGQQDDDFNAKGRLTGFLNQTDFDLSAGDATQAYKDSLDKFERCMLYIRPDIFVVIDELDAKGTEQENFEWWLNAEHDIQTYSVGAGARLQEGNAVLDAKVQYPTSGVETHYNNTFALSDMTEYPATGQYANANVQRRVWFRTPKVDRTKMIVTMDIHKDDTEARNVVTNEYETYVKMVFADGTVVLVNTQAPGTTVTTQDNISFDGTAVMYNDDSIMLALGTFLKLGDEEIIRCEDRASVVMGKDELGISTYTDQKISINIDNDYVKGITKVTDRDGNRISKAYGISVEDGMLVPSDSENHTTYVIDESKCGVIFDADKDNYSLRLNGNLPLKLADNARIVAPDGSVYGNFDIGKNLNAGDGGSVTDSTRTVENGKIGSKAHWDRNQPVNVSRGYTNEVRSISDEYKFVLGSDYLMSTGQSGKRAAQDYQTYVKLYKSATLYVFSSEATFADGWDLQTGSNFMTVQNDSQRTMKYVSSKHIDVADTNVGVDVAIPLETMYSLSSSGLKAEGVSITAIVYDEYELAEPSEIDDEPIPAPPTVSPVNAGSLKYTKDGEDFVVKDNTTGRTAKVMNGFKVKSDDSYGSKVFPNRAQPANNGIYTNEVVSISSDYNFLLGNDYVMSCLGGWDQRANSGYETEFKLYKDATVYVFSTLVNEAAAAENGWTVRSMTHDKSNAFMKIQRDTDDYMYYVLSKKFVGTDRFNGTSVVLKKEMLTSGGSAGLNFTIIDYKGADGVKFTKNGTEISVIDNNTGKNVAVMNDFKVKTSESYGSKLFPNRTQPANSGAYTNEVVSISSDYDFLLGSDYVMSCLAGWDERANNGFETEFKLYKDATVYLFATTADEAKAAENGWTMRKVTDNANAFMTIQRDQTDYMKYVLSKRFTDVDRMNGTRVEMTKEMLVSGNSSSTNFTVIDYNNNTIPADILEPEPGSEPELTSKSGADSVKIAKTNNDGTEEILAGAPTEVSKNLTPYTDENPSDGSIIMFDRGRHASYPDYNNIKEIAADYSFIIGCDYIGQPAQGNSPSHRASAGYETSFKLYEGATVYVFTSTGNSDKAAENSWTYLESGNDLPFMKLRTKPNDATDAVVGLTSVMSKHFDGAESGETVVIPKELLYRTGGDENSSGFTLFVIKYDK